ncbi:MAG TPA: nucleotide exchange factor GrpE [Kiloniellales bacterium]
MPNRKPDPKHEDVEAAEAAQEAAEEGAEKSAEAEPVEPEANEEKEEVEDDATRAARLETEVAGLRDQLLRALAEAENQRRRSQREREEAVRYAAAPVLRDLLAVADNLQRALESVPEGAAERNGAIKTLLEGVQLTERELQAVFERHGIVKLDPMGERLNPHHHEAMFEVPDPAQPSGTIVQVVQPGYILHDRLLRPARVAVAKGGPTAGPASGQGEDARTAANDDQAGEAPASNGAERGSRADSES